MTKIVKALRNYNTEPVDYITYVMPGTSRVQEYPSAVRRSRRSVFSMRDIPALPIVSHATMRVRQFCAREQCVQRLVTEFLLSLSLSLPLSRSSAPFRISA